MASSRASSMFISYRRADTGAAVRSLSGTLQQAFGPNTVFVDTEAIRVGENWPQRIEKALVEATILMVAIGPDWLKISDEHGRRRLDNSKDWVRLEIAKAIKRRITILPVTFEGAELAVPAALPPSIRGLLSHSKYEVREDFWEQDVRVLVERLSELGCKRISATVRYPKPHAFPEALTSEEQNDVLERLSGWRLVTSMIPGQEPKMRTELMKTYQFNKFEQALSFMMSAAPYISNANHHPRWENIFKSVTVWLTSWDIGFLPSHLDVELAQYLDVLYRDSAGSK
jgi:pterin-4a-carbinolamine dehydratase